MKVSHALCQMSFLAFSAGCSVGSFTGTVGGLSFSPHGSAYATTTYMADPNSQLPSLSLGVIALTSTANTCDDLTNKVVRQNEEAMLLVALHVGSTATYLPKGDYSADPNAMTSFADGSAHNLAVAVFSATDGSCAKSGPSGSAGNASAGTITVNDADGTAAHGSFSLTFGTEKATGTFSAAQCPALKTSLAAFAMSMGYAGVEPAPADPTSTCKP